MSAAWVVQALVVALLLAAGAGAADRVAGWFALPRRWIWAAAMGGSVVLPALALVVPGLLPDLGLVPGREEATATLPSGTEWVASGPIDAALVAANGSPALRGAGVPALLLGWWVVMSAIMLGGVALTYVRFRALRRACAVTEIDGEEVRLAQTAGPAVVGLLHPAIVLPAWVLELAPEERALILRHEREHLAARDGWLLLAGMLALVAIPWSFSLWWQHRRLRAAIETDCDARVLAAGVDRRGYGRILLRTAGRTPAVSVLHPAWGESISQLEWRIMNMTAKPPRHRLLRALPPALFALLVGAVACDVVGERGSTPALATAPAASEIDTVTVISAPDPSRGDLGFGYSFAPHAPIRVYDGMPRPTHFPTHPVVNNVRGSAAAAGLRDGDVIVAVNGRDAKEIAAFFPDRMPGTSYVVRVRRGDVETDLSLVVGSSRAG